jgi:hypothetical protein
METRKVDVGQRRLLGDSRCKEAMFPLHKLPYISEGLVLVNIQLLDDILVSLPVLRRGVFGLWDGAIAHLESQ